MSAEGVSPTPRARRLRLRLRVGGHERGLEVNALILMVTSLASGALGIVYWVIAERFFPTAEVGRAAAMMTTATMLSSLACLSLGGSYQRFLPVAGARTRQLVVGGIVLTTVVALLLGYGFVLVANHDDLFGNGLQRWTFPAIVAVLTTYALLDPIFIGLRRPWMVAAKNVSLSIAKVVPLPLLAFTASAFAVASSWALAALLVVVVVGLVLRAMLTRFDQVASDLPPIRQIWAFQGASLLVAVVQTVTPMCLPLIVLSRLGGDYAAYYNLAIQVGVAVALLRANLLSSYVVEASAVGADRYRLTLRMMRMMTGVCLLCAAGLALGAPVLLWITGHAYLDAALTLVLIMAVETLVGGFTAAYAGMAFVTRRLRTLAAAQVVVVIVTVGGALLLVDDFKLAGVGLALLTAQLVCAAIVATPFFRTLSAMRAEAA